MMNMELKQTSFHIEKLRHIVGSGNAAAYQICTVPGDTIGRLGHVAADLATASNDFNFKTEAARNKSDGRKPSLLSRLLGR